MIRRTRRRERSGRFGMGVALVACFSLWALPSAAHAGFLAPRDVSPPGENAYSPRLGATVSGAVIVAWNANDRGVHGRRINPDGSLSAVLDVSAGTDRVGRFDLAVDASGRSNVVWEDYWTDVIRARRVNADGSMGPPLTLSDEPMEAFDPVVAVDGQGNATFAWAARSPDHTDYAVQARRLRTDGSLGETATVFAVSSPEKAAASPRVGVSPAGDAFVAWTDGAYASSTPAGIYARKFAANGALGPVAKLGEGFPDSRGVVVDGRGKAAIVWDQTKDQWHFPGEVRLRTMKSDSSLGPNQLLSLPVSLARSAESTVAIDAVGRVATAWSGGNPSATASIQTRTVDPIFGIAGPIHTLRNAYDGGSWRLRNPQVETGTWGQIVSWDALLDGDAVEVRRISPRGSVGPVEQVVGSMFPSHPGNNDLASDRFGDATVAWNVVERDGITSRAQVAQEVLPPTCNNTSVTVKSGTTKSIAMRCSGLAITQTSIVTGPEHGRLGVVWRTPTGGMVTYTPDPGYTGADSFTFKAANRGGESAPATVRITVG